MSYRNDVDALAARRDALATELAQSTRELDRTEEQLVEARRRARLPVLDNIRIAAPCKAEWAKMIGDERVRHCGDCRKDVFDISNMTRAEAEALIVAKNGSLCVRYFQRKDGTILLEDCVVGAKRRRRRLKFVAAGVTALLAAGAGVLVTMRGHGGPQEDDGEHLAGGMVAHEPPPPEHPSLAHEVR